MSLGKNVKKINLYEKCSRIEPAFWGLTENRLKQLQAEPEEYQVKLDHNKGSFLFTSQQIWKLLEGKSPAGDGDYKITISDVKKFFKMEYDI